jgi:hypothetical protein
MRSDFCYNKVSDMPILLNTTGILVKEKLSKLTCKMLEDFLRLRRKIICVDFSPYSVAVYCMM